MSERILIEQLRKSNYENWSKHNSDFKQIEIVLNLAEKGLGIKQEPQGEPEPQQAKSSTDQRVVSRALLEETVAIMRETYDHELICNTKQFAQILVQLQNALATEKSELKAP